MASSEKTISSWYPTIALTMGDPGGIGPELVACVLGDPPDEGFRVMVFGDAQLLREAAALRQLDLPPMAVCRTWHEAARAKEPVAVVQAPGFAPGQFARCRVSAVNGRAAMRWIEMATRAVLAGGADALVTAPISKEALFAAGSAYPGHTEYLARLCASAEVRMMLEGGGLRVVLETIHVALADVPRLVQREHLIRTIEIAAGWAQRFVTPSPRIAVCGLNPHAGEAGHFGREEIDVITPAIAAARAEGAHVSGPWPADTVFYRALKGEFDLVLAMYHDQGLVAVKTVGFEDGINLSLGLPIIRTSPDHGTAFDIAWQGHARPGSMMAAVRRAVELAHRARTS